MSILRKAVFLDRDGVINQSIVKKGKPFPPSSLAEVKIIDGVAEALANLRQAGFLLMVVTNQPDVARGTIANSAVEEINSFLQQQLFLDDVFVCIHDDKDKCYCRKPLPGLILQAARKHHIDLQRSFMVGDRWKDVEAGKRAGCKTIWIDLRYDEKKPSAAPDYVTQSLVDAASWILQN